MSRIENHIPFQLNMFQKMKKEIEKPIEETQVPTTKYEPKEKPNIRASVALDILEGKITTSEKFADVRAEMDKNVPDRTSTIEEKEKAISYIDRMLKCDDITPEMKNYWSNKKDVIQMEIQTIKNEQQAGKDSNYQDVVEEYNNFIQQHWCDNYPQERNEKLEFLDSEEYGLTFYNTCVSYLNRILACNDLPQEARNHFEQEISHWNAEKQSRLGEINWYKQNHNIKTESFKNVFEEMSKNVPDRTTTIEEKRLAISYIKRMLCCDDIPSDLKEYWSNKRDIIQMEIESIKNQEKSKENEKTNDVQKEFNKFLEKFSKQPSDKLSDSDKKEYNITFMRTCISFYQRLLGCEDLSDELAAEYQNKIQDLWKNIQSQRVTYFDYYDYQRQPIVANSIEDLPKGSHDTIRDARGYNISKLNLTLEELLSLCIDKTTVMSSEQQAIIDEYTEKMKDPGLGIRDLHEQGITGKGIKMAIIDQPLGYHQEYGSNILENNDINCNDMGWTGASMHGAAVTSIAVGENTGVAPDADLVYYSAVNLSNDPKDIELYKSNILKEIESLKGKEGAEDYIAYLQDLLSNIDNIGSVSSNQPYVDAINKILDENEKLPPEERVTVISISWGFDRFAVGYEELQQALQRAKEQGVFIVSTALNEHYGFNTCGANRNPLGDVNDPNSYEAGAFWKDYPSGSMGDVGTLLLFPMDHRTVADYTDGESYRYEGNDGGMSWSTPWIAGMYVLAKQVDFSITPEEFWKLAIETSDECHNNDTGEYVGKIINPQALIDAIKQRMEENN